MTQKNKIIIASVALVGLGFYLMNRKKSNPIAENLDVPDTNTKIDYNKTLSNGTVAPEVGILQKALGLLKVDNIFGKLTEARLKEVTGKTSITINEYNQIIKK
jgi:hypothetical protein